MEAHGWACRLARLRKPDRRVSSLGSSSGRCRLARLRKPDPTLCLGNLAGLLPFRRAQDLARWAEGLRRAGPLRRLRFRYAWEVTFVLRAERRAPG